MASGAENGEVSTVQTDQPHILIYLLRRDAPSSSKKMVPLILYGVLKKKNLEKGKANKMKVKKVKTKKEKSNKMTKTETKNKKNYKTGSIA